MVMITNDVDEAILLADRIIPLNPRARTRPLAPSSSRRRCPGRATGRR